MTSLPRRYYCDPFLDTHARPARLAPGLVEVRGVTRSGTAVACRVPPAKAERLRAEADAMRQHARDRLRLASLFDDPHADPAKREALRLRVQRPGPFLHLPS